MSRVSPLIVATDQRAQQHLSIAFVVFLVPALPLLGIIIAYFL